MATMFTSPPVLSHLVIKTPIFFSPQQPPSLKLNTTFSDHQLPAVASVKVGEPTDRIASSLTRRFGLGAGLAWAAFLAVGVISEQIKTHIQVSEQEATTRDVEKQEELVLPNGLRYYDLRVGGGSSPRNGDLVLIYLKGKIQGNDEFFVDRDQKPLALLIGSRPYTKGMCEGVEEILRSIKAGGKRRVIVPPSLGFGENGADLGSGVQIPPSATLEYIVEIERVSVAPA